MRYILSALLCTLLLAGCAAPADDKPSDTTAGQESTASAYTVPTESPAEENGYPIILYAPNEDVSGFLQTQVRIPEIDVFEIFAALTEAGVLKEGAEANALRMEGSQLLLDVNDAFGAQLRGYGTSGEYYMMGSVVNTLLSAYQADTLCITINGEILETGHSIYDFPLAFYPNA